MWVPAALLAVTVDELPPTRWSSNSCALSCVVPYTRACPLQVLEALEGGADPDLDAERECLRGEADGGEGQSAGHYARGQ